MPVISRGDVELYFADSGDGFPVLLHTGGGGDGRMWSLAGYDEALSGWRLVTLDHRGHGRSGAPAGVEAHRIGEYVADVIAVLDAAEVSTAAIVGYSAGARVAYAVAARHPERCSAIVGIGGIPGPTDDPRLGLATASLVRDLGMRRLMETMSNSEPERAPSWLIDNLSGTDEEMFALWLEARVGEPGPWEDLARITAPTLLVCGAYEAAPEAADAAAARVVHGRAVILPAFGHLQTFWHGEITGRVIADFLSSVAGVD